MPDWTTRTRRRHKRSSWQLMAYDIRHDAQASGDKHYHQFLVTHWGRGMHRAILNSRAKFLAEQSTRQRLSAIHRQYRSRRA